jgi:putative ABC transport system substrate-binding protein
MAIKTIIVLLVGLALGSVRLAEAQQPKKVPRIGFLGGASASFYAARTNAFRQGLNELGYTEGKNIDIEYRYAEGKFDRLPDLAAELVGLKLDVIVAAPTPSVLAAKKASATNPHCLRFGC